MQEQDSLDRIIQRSLERLRISSLDDWDVLVFVYRHHASLLSAEQIAALLGYPGKIVADGLDRLESLGLVQRSRASQAVRLYQFSASASPHHDDFQELLRVAENRSGRLLLRQKLREGPSCKQARRRKGLYLAAKQRSKWPRAIAI